MRAGSGPRAWLGVLLVCLCAALPIIAHHSLAAEFDTRKLVHLEGVVSRIDWANPHIYVFLDVKEADGKMATWHLECVPTAMARKAGITKTQMLGDGALVKVDAYPARDGTKQLGYLARISYPDGHHFQFGPADTTASAGSAAAGATGTGATAGAGK
jgi:hypothetical protein